MFSPSSILESAERDHEQMPANCLKRKLETGGRNGFVAVEDHEMCAQEKEYNLTSEKRARFSELFTRDQLETEINKQLVSTNGEFNYSSTANNADVCSGVAFNGNSTGTECFSQNNLEWKASSEHDEATCTGMDFECHEREGCPPNLNNFAMNTVDRSTACSSTENSPDKGSPAREFLQKHRPECQMHCIPSYCHPGGLWDVMLEVYHGL